MSAGSRGANFERRVRAHLEAEGWFVVRAAGSRGPFDLVALRAGEAGGGCAVRLIQCKVRRGDFGPSDREALRSAARPLGATPVLVSRGRPGDRHAVMLEVEQRGQPRDRR